MPLYEYKCPLGHKFDAFLKLAEYDRPQHCECGQLAVKQLSMPMFSVDFPAYQSPASGKWITSRTERREDLKRTNCVEYEPSMVQEQEKRYAEADKAIENKAAEHIERKIAQMNTREQEQLGQQLESLDIEIAKA